MFGGIGLVRYGNLLASVSNDRTLRFWDVAAGRERRIQCDEFHGARLLALSRDGKTAATASSNGVVRLWEVATGKELRQWKRAERSPAHAGLVAGRPNPCSPVRRDPSSVGCGDGASEAAIERVSFMVDCLAFSPDGKALAGGSYDHMIHLWEVDTGKKLRSFSHAGGVLAVAFSPDGKTLGVRELGPDDLDMDAHGPGPQSPRRGISMRSGSSPLLPMKPSPRPVWIKRYASGMLPRGEKAHVSAATPIGWSPSPFPDRAPVGDRGERSYRLLLGDR